VEEARQYSLMIPRIILVLALFLYASLNPASAEAADWSFRDASIGDIQAVEAILSARDRKAYLVVRCDITGDRTLSIQYKPHGSVGLSMAPVILDWDRHGRMPLSSKLVWETDRAGAFARDGEEDRHASEVAEALEAQAATLRITAADRWGDPIETIYDSRSNRDVIRRVLAECPWNPEPQAQE
jgi:hypothetical protein